MRASLNDGLGFSFMTGLGESYLPAFVLAIGLGEINSGLIGGVPLLFGALFQLLSPVVVQRLNSYRKSLVFFAGAQCLLFLPLTWGAWQGSLSTLAVFAIASLYWGTGMAAGTVWNTLMGSLIPGRLRARFFASRTRLTYAGTMISFLAGGLVLQALSPQFGPSVFAALFLVAGLGRVYSTINLSRHSDYIPSFVRTNVASVSEFLKLSADPHAKQWLAFVLALKFGVYFSAPYFTPYMLQKLQLSYLEFSILTMVAFIGKIAFLPRLAEYARRHGTKTIVWLGGVGVSLLPAFWIFLSSFWSLFFVQLLSGVVWAAFELAFSLFVLESIPGRYRMGVLAVFNVSQSILIVLGTVLGGIVLSSLGTSLNAYFWVFGISTALRVLACLPLRGLPLSNIEVFTVWRSISVRPSGGGIFAPFFERLKRPDGRFPWHRRR
ncbi:MAG: MFS transporter [Bdellovibrionales bacterium]|nr:MFS transporter [Bdellovibrionales bacterium]